jgi:hypothetical protein
LDDQKEIIEKKKDWVNKNFPFFDLCRRDSATIPPTLDVSQEVWHKSQVIGRSTRSTTRGGYISATRR